ncbi:hypothetical protein GWI33_020257 [Rhynchophorus ferrugineus]|uniref:Uncharacterized protein n=1 Tax=Rhynchophorus ferrugineus TaxID=354439 RepID=A0A834LZL9_RHYFE|nr:hypothetical protein GWI33_020257 [Rhynchophorus ferrugineus]
MVGFADAVVLVGGGFPTTQPPFLVATPSSLQGNHSVSRHSCGIVERIARRFAWDIRRGQIGKWEGGGRLNAVGGTNGTSVGE